MQNKALGLLIIVPLVAYLGTRDSILGDSYSYNVVNTCQNCYNVSYLATLQFQGQSSSYINQSNTIINTANFTYCFLTPYQLVVRIIDANNQRWEVPHEYPFPHNDPNAKCISLDQASATVDVQQSPFSFKVTRKLTGETIFDTNSMDIIFSDYYLQISTKLPTQNLYGFGERNYNLDLGAGGTFTLFNKDQPVLMEDGTTGHNLYGYHPVYLQREQSNNFSMILLRSSNAMDVVIQDQQLTYKVIGGIFEFNFFLGDNVALPETVVQQYHQFLGGWIMAPFWSFGHHQSRWGYANVGMLEDVLQGYQSNNLPLDVIWSDINYMKDYVDFLIDTANFPPAQMNSMLQQYKKRWVPIVDAGIALNNNPYFNQSVEEDIYIKDPDGIYLLGQVWPGDVHYPDFFQPNTTGYWHFGLDLVHSQVPFSGIWIDMNEASNFVPGEENWSPNPNDLMNLPPYNPSTPGDMIYTKTMRMDAVHANGMTEYNIHNFFGFLESQATQSYLSTISNLTFILSRSTFYGSGQFTSHWTGDNGATWEFLQVSGPDLMNFNIFGIPHVGPDMCGFAYNTTEELCSRWYQAGTLYPFSRNHNSIDQLPQEPYNLGPTLLETARLALNLRYSLLKHFYGIFLQKRGKGTIFRPLFFDFPADSNFFDHSKQFTDNEYLIGHALVVAPVMQQGANSVNIYLPQATWYDFSNGNVIQLSTNANPAPFDYSNPLNTTVPMFIRGGYIVSTQNTTGVSSSADLDGHYNLVVALQQSAALAYTAVGSLTGISNMEDSNVVSKCISNNCIYNVHAGFTILSGNYALIVVLTISGATDLTAENIYIDSLTVFGTWSSEESEKMRREFPTIEWVLEDKETGDIIDVEVNVLSDSSIHIVPSSPAAVYNNLSLTFKGLVPEEKAQEVDARDE